MYIFTRLKRRFSATRLCTILPKKKKKKISGRDENTKITNPLIVRNSLFLPDLFLLLHQPHRIPMQMC